MKPACFVIPCPSGSVSASSPEMAERLAAIMAAYTSRHNAEQAYAQAVRDGRLKAPEPVKRWEISDRD